MKSSLEFRYPWLSKLRKRGKQNSVLHTSDKPEDKEKATLTELEASNLAKVEDFDISKSWKEWQALLTKSCAKKILRELIVHLTYPPEVTIAVADDETVQLSNGQSLAQEKLFNHSERIIAEGDRADRMFIVKYGVVEALSGQSSGAASEHCFRKGECFGELSTLFFEPHQTTVRAITDVRDAIIDALVAKNEEKDLDEHESTYDPTPSTRDLTGLNQHVTDGKYRQTLEAMANSRLEKVGRKLLGAEEYAKLQHKGKVSVYELTETHISTCLGSDAGLATEALLLSLTPRSMRRRKPRFPGTLLAGNHVRRKLKKVTRMLHRWNQFVTMLDRDDSGYLSTEQLRCTLLAFSAMGLIAERFEYHPLAENFEDYNDLSIGEAEIADMKDDDAAYYEVNLGPGKALLLGMEGVPLHKPHGITPWAMYIDFKLDPSMIGTMHNDTKFNVLICSYQMAALIVELRLNDSGDREIRLLYVPANVMDGSADRFSGGKRSSLSSRLEDFVSRNEPGDQTSSSSSDEDDDDQDEGLETSSYHDTAALTTWFQVPELEWHRLQLRAVRAPSAKKQIDLTDHEQRFHVEIACFKLPGEDHGLPTNQVITTYLNPATPLAPKDDPDAKKAREREMLTFQPRFKWTGKFNMNNHFALGNTFSTATMVRALRTYLPKLAARFAPATARHRTTPCHTMMPHHATPNMFAIVCST
jgi:hypothetical protein